MIKKIKDFLTNNFCEYKRTTPKKLYNILMDDYFSMDDFIVCLANDEKINPVNNSDYRILKDFLKDRKIYFENDSNDFFGDFHAIRNIIGASVITKNKMYSDALTLKSEIEQTCNIYFSADNNTDFIIELSETLETLKDAQINDFILLISDFIKSYYDIFISWIESEKEKQAEKQAAETVQTETETKTIASSKQTIINTSITNKQLKKVLKGFTIIFRDVIRQARNRKKQAENNTSRQARIIPGSNKNIKKGVFWVVSEKKKARTSVFSGVNTCFYTFKTSYNVFQALPVYRIPFKMLFSGGCLNVIRFDTS